MPAVVASYQTGLALNDLITAILLFTQFSLLRSRALLLLASGYLFTAVAAVVHALSYPDVFAPNGLLGAGPQTTSWLYIVWHGGFPLLALGYALLKDKDGGAKIQGSVLLSVVIGSDGVARDIQVKQGLDSGLDNNAIAAVQNWKFQPGTKDGQPVRVQATIEVNFRLL